MGKCGYFKLGMKLTGLACLALAQMGAIQTGTAQAAPISLTTQAEFDHYTPKALGVRGFRSGEYLIPDTNTVGLVSNETLTLYIKDNKLTLGSENAPYNTGVTSLLLVKQEFVQLKNTTVYAYGGIGSFQGAGDGLVVDKNFTSEGVVHTMGGAGDAWGSNAGGAGIRVGGDFSLASGGEIIAWGGKGGEPASTGRGGKGGAGIAVTGNFTAGDKTNIQTTGGVGGNANGMSPDPSGNGGAGIYTRGDFKAYFVTSAQGGNSGTGATAGAGGYGIEVLSNFTNGGWDSTGKDYPTQLYATGGNSLASGISGGHGIHTGTFTNISGATVTAKGGTGAEGGAGLYVVSGLENHGTIKTTGGGRYGLRVGTFTNSSRAKLEADGGSAGGDGVYVSASFKNEGNVTATGGTGGHGINAYASFDNSGKVVAKGGTSSGHGISTIDFTNNGTGLVAATGGAAGRGISVANTFTNIGRVEASGGANAYGIYANIFKNQYGGQVTANGGPRYAIWANTFISDKGGSVLAKGGDRHAIYIDKTFTNNGILTLTHGTAAAVHVGNTGNAATALTFGADSFLKVTVDGAKPGQAPGVIEAAKGKTVIASGAVLKPEVNNAAQLATGQSMGGVFLKSPGGIDGAFSGGTSNNGVLKYLAAKSADGQKYSFTVSKVDEVSDVVPGFNNKSLFEGVQKRLIKPVINNKTYNLLSGAYDNIINQLDQTDLINMANDYQKQITPWQNTLAPVQFLGQSTMLVNDFGDNLYGKTYGNIYIKINPDGTTETVTAPGAGETDFDKPENRFSLWLNPVYQTGTQKAADYQYDDMDQDFGGISLGGALNLPNDFALGLGVHYLKGRSTSSGYTAETDTMGAMLGLGKLFRINDLWNPWAQIHLGYSYQTIDQDRDTLDGFTASSDPHAQLFNAGFELRNTFQVSDSLAITPKVGLDYTHVAMSDYSENGGSALNLDVNSDDLDSLQSVVGAKAEWMFTPLIGLDAHGYYRYEFLDTQVRFASEFLGLRDVSFETESPDLNGHSGNIGAAFIFVPAENASVNLGYDLWLADEYVGHQISATVQMEF